ncbi:hypothetical protein C6P45_003456 [Maudiozyma exigua]|uniref:Uncharacterized protein n=1 Tax=Maudiozyma exigua TaxID=34358 RepID=A0A9P7B1K4_MAUEX|nr:hypothetical protein C6P45_003456 [Kazachstania exigua]
MTNPSTFFNINVIDSNFTVRPISLPDNFTEASFQNYENKSDNDYILITSDSPENENVSSFLKDINMLDRIKSFRNRFQIQESHPENCTMLQFFLKDDGYIEELDFKKDSITLCMFKNFITLFGTILNKKNLLDALVTSIQKRRVSPVYFPIVLEELVLDRMDQYLTNWLDDITHSIIKTPDMEKYKKYWLKNLKWKEMLRYYAGNSRPNLEGELDMNYLKILENPKKMRNITSGIKKEFSETSANLRRYRILKDVSDFNGVHRQETFNYFDKLDHKLSELIKNKNKMKLFFQHSFLISMLICLVVTVKELYTIFQTNSVNLTNKFIISSVWLVVGIIVSFSGLLGKG